MTVTYWTGGGADDKFSTAGNWSDGAPGTGDTAIINDTDDDIVSETFATSFEELRIGDNFTGSVGVVVDTGSSLGVTATTVVLDTSATVYLDVTASLVLLERTAAGDDAVRLEGTCGTLRVLDARGEVVVGSVSSTSVSGVEMLGGRMGTLAIHGNTTIGAANVSLSEGTLAMNNAATACSGVWTLVGGTLKLSGGDFTGGTWNVWGSTRITDTRDANSAIGTLNMYGGNWNGKGTTADLLTFSNLTLYGDATFDERSGLHNSVYTNGIIFAGEGVFRPDTGRELSQP
jgi:hypothetical protein